VHDLRDAWRALRATPIASAVAILSLALGIGANTAIFSILNGLLLKPLPLREPNRLVLVGSDDPYADASHSYAIWTEIRDRRLFDRPFAWATDRVSLASTGEADFAEAIWATGNFFEALGVPAIVGRTFGERDDRRSGGPDGAVAVLSYRMWHARFGGDPGAIGRTLTIHGAPFTIVGVTPPEFLGLHVGFPFDVILPLDTEALTDRRPPHMDSRYWPWLQIMARLAPHETPEALTSTLRLEQPHIREATMPDFRRAQDRDRFLSKPWTVRPAPAGVSRLRRQYEPALMTLFGVVSLVLLIACANIAVLLLARTAARRYELSVRLALGASQRRLVRQLLVESLLLSAIGAVIGLAFAQWGARLLVAQLSNWYYTVFVDLSLDGRVLGVTAAVTVATALLFGTAPAYRAVRVEPIEALRLQPRGLAGGARSALGGWLVIVQVALSLMLVVGAGLFLRSFAALAYRDLGFDRSRVVIAVVDARRTTVRPAGRAALFERVREAAASVAGVESAATSMATPLGNAGVRFTHDLDVPQADEHRPALPSIHVSQVFTTPVSPGWFRTYGTRLLAGRDFKPSDAASAAPVAIVNQAFARRYLGGANPIGRTMVDATDPSNRRTVEIVGFVEDAAFTSVRDAIEPTMYVPLAQGVDEELLAHLPSICVSVRAVQPARLTKSLAAAIGGVDGNLSIEFQSVVEQLNYYYIRERLLALVSGFFGALALLLAALGLYGVTAFAVNRRRTEIGIRMALGASPGAVAWLVIGGVVRLVVAGVAVGIVVSLWTVRVIGALLYGLQPRDPLTFGAACAVLLVVAIAAGSIPTWRASRIDPASVLKEA
jgi:predicted permease